MAYSEKVAYMKKMILVFGTVAGVAIILGMILGFYATGTGDGTKNFSEWLGYLTMLVGLSVIFVGVKRYRDQELGGVIKFGTGLAVGLGITVVASIAYVTTWEIHLAMTDYVFINEYTDSLVADAKANSVTAAELDKLLADNEEMKIQYAQLLFRLPMTFMEIFPMGLLISLISAAVLRNAKVMPATA